MFESTNTSLRHSAFRHLRNKYSESGLVTHYRDWQIPLGRRFRSLKIWFVIRTYGITGFQNHVLKGINNGEVFAVLVKGKSDLFEILGGPQFALVVLRLTAGGDSRMLEPKRMDAEGLRRDKRGWRNLPHEQSSRRRDVCHQVLFRCAISGGGTCKEGIPDSS